MKTKVCDINANKKDIQVLIYNYTCDTVKSKNFKKSYNVWLMSVHVGECECIHYAF